MRTGAAYVQGYIDGFDQSELLALGLDIIDAYIFQWYLDFAVYRRRGWLRYALKNTLHWDSLRRL